jgi:hypothetical protein
LLEVVSVGGAFLRLNRVVFDYMPYETVHVDGEGKKLRWYFWQGPQNGVYVGEDIKFCLGWRAIGSHRDYRHHALRRDETEANQIEA